MYSDQNKTEEEISAEEITHISKKHKEDSEEKHEDGRHHVTDIEQIQHLRSDHLTMTNIIWF